MPANNLAQLQGPDQWRRHTKAYELALRRRAAISYTKHGRLLQPLIVSDQPTRGRRAPQRATSLDHHRERRYRPRTRPSRSLQLKTAVRRGGSPRYLDQLQSRLAKTGGLPRRLEGVALLETLIGHHLPRSFSYGQPSKQTLVKNGVSLEIGFDNNVDID